MPVIFCKWYRQIPFIAIFQSPFHRGNGCNISDAEYRIHCFTTFSPLFIGETVVTRNKSLSSLEFPNLSSFSPLFIGETVVTACTGKRDSLVTAIVDFQSPFHRGNGCNVAKLALNCWAFIFQSPFHRGNGCNRTRV